MRILWHSNAPWIRTGYGTQTALWVPRLAALGHELIISGPFSFAGSPMAWGEFQVLPGGEDPFGSDVIGSHYARNRCDLLITLCDVFMMNPVALHGLNVAHWFPIDCDPMGTDDQEHARGSMAQIALSRHGERMLRDAGFDPFYVPHGIDTQMFVPPADKNQLRESLGFESDAFLIGVNAANKNGPRKGIMEQVIAFAEFHDKHPEARLLIHSAVEPGEGLNVKAMAQGLGCLNALMPPDQYAYRIGIMDTPVMASWYGVLDVFANASYGEGFGVPIIEAQACGTPVITTRGVTSMPELNGAGWDVESEKFWVGGHNAFWHRPLVSSIVDAYESAWQAKQDGTMPQLQAQAREFAMGYDADYVLETYWVPVLEALDEMRPKVRHKRAAAVAELPIPVESIDEHERDLLLIVPSRGRPANVQRLIEATRATAKCRTDILFGFDEDDPTLSECVQLVDDAALTNKTDRVSVNALIGPRKGLAEWTNVIARANVYCYFALCSLGDDHCPQTEGWDLDLLKVLWSDGPGFAYPDDTVRNDIPQIVVVTSDVVQELGWFCLPELSHYYVDNVWAELGRNARCITFLPDTLVEHVHYLKKPGEVKRDQTYRDNEKKLIDDQAAFSEWRMNRAEADFAKIRAVRERWQAARADA